jgi:Golgi apyrase
VVLKSKLVLVSGISSFAENPKGVSEYLQPFLDYTRTHLPPSVEIDTPIFLLATAGMRLLTQEQQVEILEETCHFFKTQSNFRIDSPSSAGPCGSSIRIITGEEEGLFGWLSVNYLMDGFTGHSQDRTTYGFLDMGGASTQIAFEPSLAERNNPENNLIEVRLRLLGGEEIVHKVFVTTWLGYGTNQARERYVAQAVNAFESNRSTNSSSSSDTILDPCLPKDLKLVGQPLQPPSASQHSKQPHTLVGTGSFEQCLEKTSPLLNKDAPCSAPPCLFNGVHVPPIDFSVSHFIGVSEYWYSAEHVFGLGGAYDFVQYERAAAEFCQREWTDILQQHKSSQLEGGKERLGGDGEVEKDGRIVSVGKWGDNVEIPRLQMQCFKAAWIVNVLHSGLGMPRIIDPKGNLTVTEGGPAVSAQAQQKGLGRPAFQSVNNVGDIAFSWTLGKMVLEASKEVPPLSSTTKPITDPLDGWSRPHWMDSPFAFSPPFWDFDTIEDKLSDHLPTSLTRKSLGFSLVGFRFLYLHVRRVGDDYVEVEVLLAGYVQADYEVRLKRKEWEWWVHRWEEVYNGQLRYGRRPRQWWSVHVSTLVAPFVVIKLKAWFDFQVATAVQPRPATRIFDPFSCPKAFCAQHLAFEELFLGINPRLLEVEPKSIILVPAPCSTLLRLTLLVLISSEPQSFPTLSLAPLTL